MSPFLKKQKGKKKIGAVWSSNMAKAERTIKKMPAKKKKAFFKKYGK
jgi:hypothetical protein